MPTPIFASFDPRNVFLTIRHQGTERAMIGFAEGEYIVIEPSQPRASVLVGVDGKFITSRGADEGVFIDLNLFAHSISNRRLNEIASTSNRFAVSFASIDTNEHGFSPSAQIVDYPIVAVGESAGVRNWRIYASAWSRGGVEVITEG